MQPLSDDARRDIGQQQSARAEFIRFRLQHWTLVEERRESIRSGEKVLRQEVGSVLDNHRFQNFREPEELYRQGTFCGSIKSDLIVGLVSVLNA